MGFREGDYKQSVGCKTFSEAIEAIEAIDSFVDIQDVALVGAGVLGNIYMGSANFFLHAILFEATNLFFMYTQAGKLPQEAKKEPQIFYTHCLFSTLPCLLYVIYYLGKHMQASLTLAGLECETSFVSANTSALTACVNLAEGAVGAAKEEMALLANVGSALLPYILRHCVYWLGKSEHNNMQYYEAQLLYFWGGLIKKRLKGEELEQIEKSEERDPLKEDQKTIDEYLRTYRSANGEKNKNTALEFVRETIRDISKKLTLEAENQKQGKISFAQEEVKNLKETIDTFIKEKGSGNKQDDSVCEELEISFKALLTQEKVAVVNRCEEYKQQLIQRIGEGPLTRENFQASRFSYFSAPVTQALLTDEFTYLRSYKATVNFISKGYKLIETILSSQKDVASMSLFEGGLEGVIDSKDEGFITYLEAYSQLLGKSATMEREVELGPQQGKNNSQAVLAGLTDLFACCLGSFVNVYMKNSTKRTQGGMFLFINSLTASGQFRILKDVPIKQGQKWLWIIVPFLVVYGLYCLALVEDYEGLQSFSSIAIAFLPYCARIAIQVYANRWPDLQTFQTKGFLALSENIVNLVEEKAFYCLDTEKGENLLSELKELQSSIDKSSVYGPSFSSLSARGLSKIQEVYALTQESVFEQDVFLSTELEHLAQSISKRLPVDCQENIQACQSNKKKVHLKIQEYHDALYLLLKQLTGGGSAIEKIPKIEESLTAAQQALNKAQEEGLESTINHQETLQTVKSYIACFFVSKKDDKYLCESKVGPLEFKKLMTVFSAPDKKAPETILQKLRWQTSLFSKCKQNNEQNVPYGGSDNPDTHELV